MPRAHPPEFRRRVVELARERAKPIALIAADIGISESCLRHWLAQAEIEAVAIALNSRPRKTLGWKTPAEALNEHLLLLEQAGVATTP